MSRNFFPHLPKLPEDHPPGIPTPPAMQAAPPVDEPEARMRVHTAPEVWHRQHGEGEEAWTKFVAYRDSPRPRRMVRPGAGNTAELYDLSKEWGWFQRVEAYDVYMDKVRLREVEYWVKQDAREVTAEHMAMLRDAREFVTIEMHRILERAKKSSIDGTLKATEVIRITEMVLKYDRLLRNQTTENSGVQVAPTDVNYEELSIEDLREMRAMNEKMQKRKKATP